MIDANYHKNLRYNTMIVKIYEYDQRYFELSKKWLADAEIKRLTLAPDVNEKTRKKWFDSLIGRKDYLIWGLEVEGHPVGAVGIKKINYNEAIGEYWGYIGEKDYIGKGIGKAMIAHMIDEALKIGLKELFLEVSDYNIRAIKLYENMGFREYKREDASEFQLVYMRRSLINNET